MAAKLMLLFLRRFLLQTRESAAYLPHIQYNHATDLIDVNDYLPSSSSDL